jgi:hypothetical protein
MVQYISKDALVAEITKIYDRNRSNGFIDVCDELDNILSLIDTLEVKELAPIAYVVTRCEEHSDYVEEVFFNEDKAQAYCDQFKGNENEYARHITKVEVIL